MGAKARSHHDEFDPMVLHNAFERMIQDLKHKNAMVQQRVDKLEVESQDEEKKLWSKIVDLQRNNQVKHRPIELEKFIHRSFLVLSKFPS